MKETLKVWHDFNPSGDLGVDNSTKEFPQPTA